MIAKGGGWTALMTAYRLPLSELPRGLKDLTGEARNRPFKVLLTSDT